MSLALRFGTIAALVLVLVMFGPYFLFGPRPDWMDAGQVIGYTAMVLCMTATYFAMRREQAQRAGTLGYGPAFAIGTAVAGVAGVLFGLATWLFFEISGDALPQTLMDYYAAQIREGGGTPTEIAAGLSELEEMRPMLFNRPLQGAIMGATVFLVGLVESLIGAWFVRQRTN